MTLPTGTHCKPGHITLFAQYLSIPMDGVYRHAGCQYCAVRMLRRLADSKPRIGSIGFIDGTRFVVPKSTARKPPYITVASWMLSSGLPSPLSSYR